MRTLTLMAGADGYRLAFVGPDDQFEVIGRFTSWDAASQAYAAAKDAGELVLTIPYLQQKAA